MNYYDDVIQEIRQAIHSSDLEEAAFLLKREFSMPYIPREAEAQLRKLEKELRYLQSEKKEDTELSLEKLLKMLKGKPETQLRAADQLTRRNLRSITSELQDWLSKDPLPEAAAVILEGLAEQQVPEEFVYAKDGVEYTFFGDALTPVSESGGYRRALAILKEKYMKEPSMLEMAKTLLAGRCYMALPISFEEEDGEFLAEQTDRALQEAMNAAREAD